MNLEQWFDAYGVSHKNNTNIIIHKFCVPAILWSVVALLSSIPVPSFFMLVPFLNWATIIAFCALIFYFTLGVKPFAIMLIQLGIALFSLNFFPPAHIAKIGFGVFVIAWIFQFVGHKIEGKKPSFIEDIKFLLIGPLWIIKGLF